MDRRRSCNLPVGGFSGCSIRSRPRTCAMSASKARTLPPKSSSSLPSQRSSVCACLTSPRCRTNSIPRRSSPIVTAANLPMLSFCTAAVSGRTTLKRLHENLIDAAYDQVCHDACRRFAYAIDESTSDPMQPSNSSRRVRPRAGPLFLRSIPFSPNQQEPERVAAAGPAGVGNRTSGRRPRPWRRWRLRTMHGHLHAPGPSRSDGLRPTAATPPDPALDWRGTSCSDRYGDDIRPVVPLCHRPWAQRRPSRRPGTPFPRPDPLPKGKRLNPRSPAPSPPRHRSPPECRNAPTSTSSRPR